MNRPRLKRPVDKKPRKEKRDRFGHTPLMAACYANDLDRVRSAIKGGANVDAATLPEDEELQGALSGYAITDGGESALMIAARQASAEVVRALVEAGANVHHMDAQYDTGLSSSVLGPDALAKVHYLVGRGARLEPKGGLTVLYVAASNGKLALGARPNARIWTKATPLMAAAQSGHLGVVRVLLAAKADMSAVNDQGETALHLAANSARTNVVRLLITHGASVNGRDNLGNTPLMLACRNGQPAITRLLLETGRANVRLRNKKKHTALIEAVSMNAIACVRHLLAHGAKITDRDQDGLSALEIAGAHTDYAALARMLRAASRKASAAERVR